MSLKTKWMSRICVIVIAIFLVNYVAMEYHWYRLIWWFDMPMHFMGGLFIGLLTLWSARYTRLLQPIFGAHMTNYTALALMCVLVTGIGWEIFEFSLQTVTFVALVTPLDSASDMFFDLAGGATAVLYVYDQMRRVPEAKEGKIPA